jgi:type VI protein secretion system component VasF
MYAIFIAICALVILLGFEIRYREMIEELVELDDKMNGLLEDISRLKEDMKLKKDIYEEHKGPA